MALHCPGRIKTEASTKMKSVRNIDTGPGPSDNLVQHEAAGPKVWRVYSRKGKKGNIG